MGPPSFKGGPEGLLVAVLDQIVLVVKDLNEQVARSRVFGLTVLRTHRSLHVLHCYPPFLMSGVIQRMDVITRQTVFPRQEGVPMGEDRVSDFARRYLDSQGRVTSIPAKRAMKEALVAWAARRFEPGRPYSESQVNEVIAPVMEDYVWLRRMLVDGGYLIRDDRGTAYRLAGPRGEAADR